MLMGWRKPQLSAFYCQQHLPDTEHTNAGHLTGAGYVTELIYSCSQAGFPDDYCFHLSGKGPSKFELQKAFS